MADLPHSFPLINWAGEQKWCAEEEKLVGPQVGWWVRSTPEDDAALTELDPHKREWKVDYWPRNLDGKELFMRITSAGRLKFSLPICNKDVFYARQIMQDRT